jgi:hypothetical protein
MKSIELNVLHTFMKNKIPLATAILVSSVLSIAFPPRAQAEIPMKIESIKGAMILEVPDTDVTTSAYGDSLRQYDVHIAKMFRETYDECHPMAHDNAVFTWIYKITGSEQRTMEIKIPCRLAYKIVDKYEIRLSSPAREKIDEWMIYTDKIKVRAEANQR